MQIEEEKHHGLMLWMLPFEEDNQDTNRIMVEKMVTECGRLGFSYIMGSIDENSPCFDLFREIGFFPLGWEQVWQYLPKDNKPDKKSGTWIKTTTSHLQQIAHIRNELLSRTEKLLDGGREFESPRYSLVADEKVIGYATVAERLDQVIITPYFAHDVIEPENSIFDLLNMKYADFSTRFIIQQSNLHLSTSVLSEKCKKVSGKRKRIVKHIAIREMDAISEFNHAANGQNTNIVTPISK